MTDKVAGPDGSALSEGLGPLPPHHFSNSRAKGGALYTADQMRAFRAAGLAAERERCDVLTDEMLRYAMAAIGTGSPADADRFRLFWRFAIEARNTRA